jgi:hypothetical protein
VCHKDSMTIVSVVEGGRVSQSRYFTHFQSVEGCRGLGVMNVPGHGLVVISVQPAVLANWVVYIYFYYYCIDGFIGQNISHPGSGG